MSSELNVILRLTRNCDEFKNNWNLSASPVVVLRGQQGPSSRWARRMCSGRMKRGSWLGLEDQEGYLSTKKSGKWNSMRKDIEAWVGVQCPQEWWIHNNLGCACVVSVGLQLWKFSPHISQVRRLRPRDIKEPVVDKLSAGCFYPTSPAPPCLTLIHGSSFVFFFHYCSGI